LMDTICHELSLSVADARDSVKLVQADSR
jgi:hypothetical protein